MRIAITGGTGSLGGALIKRLARSGADRIVTMSRDEQRRLNLQRMYEWQPAVKCYAGDVRDEDRLRDVFAGCEVVVHAAARKVVTGHFDEPREMLKTNVEGTANVLAAARHAGCAKVLFISSDKAVEPTNVYGVSKAMAEFLVVSENARCFSRGMRCSVIRYGNVLGSTGSVVKVWKEAAASGEALKISDRRMTRFWLPIDEAAGLVLRALQDMRGGEVLVPRLKAAPLMRLMEAVGGTSELEVEDVGIRPGGEKMHEKLLDEDELRRARMRQDWIMVPPVDSPDLWDRNPWLGEGLPEGFEYRSDTWPEQWTVEELRAVLSKGGEV